MKTVHAVLIVSMVRERIEKGDHPKALIDILIDVISASEPALAAELNGLTEAYFKFGEWRPPARSAAATIALEPK